MISGVSYGNEKNCPLNKLILMSPDSSKVFTVQRYAQKSYLRCFQYESKTKSQSSTSDTTYYDYEGMKQSQNIVYDYNFPKTKLDNNHYSCQTIALHEVYEGLLGADLVYIHTEVNTSASPSVFTSSYSKQDFEKRKIKELVWVNEDDLLGTELKIGDKLDVHYWTTDEGAGPLGIGMYKVIGCRK